MFQTTCDVSVILRCGSYVCLRSPQPARIVKMRKLNTLLFVCFALLLASTVRAQTSGVNNAQLNGDYAFTFNGFNVGAGGSSVFATVGRFSADGAGNVTNGEMDTNGVGPAAVLTAQTFTGAYAIGADNRGVMTLNTQGGSARLAFAMMPNGNAQFIKFDAAGGTGTVGSGTIEKVDTTAYNTANITGDYAFGVAGFDASNNRAAFAGRLTANGAGAFTNGAADIGQFGTTSSVIFTTANYAVSDTTRGRGAINLASLIGGASRNFDFVFYVVNAGKLFAMETDGVTGSTPLLNGVVLQQQTPAGGFSNASLNGDMVLYLTARSMCGSGSVPVAIVLVGLLTAGGNGALSLTFDQNCGGATNSVTALMGTYIVATNGRSTMMIGQYNTVAYLVSANQAFFLGTDSSGFVDPQAAGSLTNSAVQGTYAGSAISPATSNVAIFSGEFTADGASPTGNITGIEDIGASSGPVSGSAFNATYSISSSPTNGRGTMTITSGSGGSAVVYVVSPSKFVVVPLNDPNPAVWIFEGSSLPSTLSSLALDPTSVVGGVQSSTGTVTLSGPAPAGDAQVLLSSSNTAVASVPSSVTVPAGATSATFTVTTSTVAASTSVTISASYGGVSKTAALTVTPSAPPPLSSLALNPASVVGGAQSSTGTVTLSGPAPAGGAQVTLSSSNTAVASVPFSVTVPAGATIANFTVYTSVVLFSTSVNISASSNGTTRTASLTSGR